MRRDLEEQKQRKLQKMDIYRDTLGYQQQIHDYNKDKFGAMTQQEKNFNRQDLRGFKQEEKDVHAMIPGLNNLSSIGSVPTLRKAYNHSASYTPQDFRADHFPQTD